MNLETMRKDYTIVATSDIRVTEKSQLFNVSKEKEIIAQKLWRKASEEGDLSNGFILNFVRSAKTKDGLDIEGSFVEYKYFFAQRNSGIDYGIQPIAVSGITVACKPKACVVLFAQRSVSVTEYPSFFELVPSGSIDKSCVTAQGKIDYQAKLLSELAEETYLEKSCVKRIRTFAFVFDPNHRVYDICCEIILKDEVNVDVVNLASEEYDSAEWVKAANIKEFIKKHKNYIVPASLAILKAWKPVFK